ncbi:MAG: SDR family oxidoreductase [Chitinophagaceae bacterium]|nr:MAG: SDR family oxidoreductase [Chitinophagaceae bacterium]
MQTVLITGANGFVGNYLSERLAPHLRVLATGKGDCRLSFNAPSLQYRELDITDRGAVEILLKEERPGCIIHAAAISKPDLCEQDRALANSVNVDGTRHLLEYAAGAHFVYLSTDFVFDGEKGFYQEDDAQAPVNYYGETKRIAEELVRSYEGDWAIVRTVLVYGAPRAGRGNLLTMVADGLRAGKTLRIFNDQLRTPTYVEDLVEALARITFERKTGAWHISGADPRTPYEIAVEVARHLGLNETLIIPETEQSFAQPARRPPKTGFDINKARRELGYEPVSFEEGLRRTFRVPEEKER